MKAALRGHDYATQVQMLAPDGPLAGATDVHSAAEKGISGSSGALPHAAKIQQIFGGYDLSNIQAHTDGAAQQSAAAMGADAYATGNHVVFNKGGADLHTAAHEAAHVVQQSGGVVLSGGVGKSGDVYEKHADKVADAVVAGESAEGLFGEMAGGGSGTQVVQRKPGGKRDGPQDAESSNRCSNERPVAEGSGAVLAASGETEYGAVGYMHQQLPQLLRENPDMSIDDILTHLSGSRAFFRYLEEPAFPQFAQNTTIARTGKAPPAPRESSSTGKKAVLVENAFYRPEEVMDLPTLAGRSRAVGSGFAARGFESRYLDSVSSIEMTASYRGLIDDAAAGDSRVAFFTGHGMPAGLTGANLPQDPSDVMPKAEIGSLIQAATAKGVHLRVIIEACHAGVAANVVRDERESALRGAIGSGKAKAAFDVSGEARLFRKELVDHVRLRREALLWLDDIVLDYKDNPMPDQTEQANAMESLVIARERLIEKFNSRAEFMWAFIREWAPGAVAGLTNACEGTFDSPALIDDFARLGTAIDFLDTVIEAALDSAQEIASEKVGDK